MDFPWCLFCYIHIQSEILCFFIFFSLCSCDRLCIYSLNLHILLCKYLFPYLPLSQEYMYLDIRYCVLFIFVSSPPSPENDTINGLMNISWIGGGWVGGQMVGGMNLTKNDHSELLLSSLKTFFTSVAQVTMVMKLYLFIFLLQKYYTFSSHYYIEIASWMMGRLLFSH